MPTDYAPDTVPPPEATDTTAGTETITGTSIDPVPTPIRSSTG